MTVSPQNADRLVKLFVYVGGVVSTAVGALFTNKIRIYHDNRKAHFDEIKQRVLLPFYEATTGDFPKLVSHELPVVHEKWGIDGIKADARVTESDAQEGSGLIGVNPWSNVFSSVDEALYEDAKQRHFPKLIGEVVNLANAWARHVESCRSWIQQMAAEILVKSGMHAYGPPFEAPYVLHYRLGVFAYRRLFWIRTGALHKRSQGQGQMWTLEGAPGLPDMIGCSAIAPEQQIDTLTTELDKIISSHRENAERLREESQRLGRDVAAVHDRLQLTVASKRLRKRCDLVRFF